MRKLTRNITLALMLATTCGAIAHADDPTGTDPVPPTHSTGSSTTIATILEVLTGFIL